MRAQSAVIASWLVTARTAQTRRVGPVVAHDPGRVDREQHGEVLPDSPVKPALSISSRTIASARRRMIEILAVDLAENTHRQAGTREWLPIDHFVRQPERPTNRPDFILEQEYRSGSTSSNFMSSGRPPTLWWVLILTAALVSLRRALDHVRIERALGQEFERSARSPPPLRRRERIRPPMIFRFSSGSVTPARRPRNRSVAST